MPSSIKNIVGYIKKNKFYIIAYMIFFVICVLTPISGDDYGNFVKGQEGFLRIIQYTKSFYLNWEGRIISRIIILIFTYHKFLWNIVTPFLFVLIFKNFLEINSFKNKNSFLILLTSLIAVNTSMFAQSYTWLAGNITYFYPSALLIYYFVTLYKNINGQLNIKQIALLCILAIIIPMFTENIGCAFVVGNILFLIYSYYFKRKIKINCILLVFSTLSLILMLASPGSAKRIVSEGYFYSLSIFEKISSNLSYNFIRYTLTRYTTMLILMLICCNIYIVKKTKIGRNIKIILCTLFDLIPIYTILQNLITANNIKFLVLFSTYKWYYYPYWLLFCTLFLLSLIATYKDNKKVMLFYIVLIAMSFSSVLCMLVVWPWGDRISILLVILLTYISVSIIDKNIEFNYLINYMAKLFFCIVILIIGFNMFCTYKIDKYRISYTQEQIMEGKKVIEVIYHPLPYIWLPNLNGEYFVETYKEYQKIDSEVKLILKRLSIKEYIDIIFCNM